VKTEEEAPSDEQTQLALTEVCLHTRDFSRKMFR